MSWGIITVLVKVIWKILVMAKGAETASSGDAVPRSLMMHNMEQKIGLIVMIQETKLWRI